MCRQRTRYTPHLMLVLALWLGIGSSCSAPIVVVLYGGPCITIWYTYCLYTGIHHWSSKVCITQALNTKTWVCKQSHDSHVVKCRHSSGTSKTPCTPMRLGKERTTTQVQPQKQQSRAAALRCLIRWHACRQMGSAEPASCLPKSACRMMLAAEASGAASPAVLQGMPPQSSPPAQLAGLALTQAHRLCILCERGQQQPSTACTHSRRYMPSRANK